MPGYEAAVVGAGRVLGGFCRIVSYQVAPGHFRQRRAGQGAPPAHGLGQVGHAAGRLALGQPHPPPPQPGPLAPPPPGP